MLPADARRRVSGAGPRYPVRMQSWGSEYRTQSSDTSIAAERVQFDAYRGLAPAEKLALILDLCETGRELTLAGVRIRHPHATLEELELRATGLRLGAELARRVYGRRFDDLAR